jgi:hypothetical protein
MYQGTVTFSAHIKGNGLTFSLCEFNPREPGVEKVELEGRNGDQNGNEILSTVYLASVATREAGTALATKVNTAALNRISFLHSIVIENHTITGGQLVLVNPPPGTVELQGMSLTLGGRAVGLLHGISAVSLKTELEQSSHPGEHYYGLLRSARQSMSPVEEFVHVRGKKRGRESFLDKIGASSVEHPHASPSTPCCWRSRLSCPEPSGWATSFV